MTKSTTIEFSLLTLNTMGAPFKSNLKGRYQKIAASIQNSTAEFFALQETFHAQKTQDWILQTLGQQMLHVAKAHDPSWRRLKTIGSGLTSLSRHPILKEEFYSFKFLRSVDRFSNKGVLLTRILLNNTVEIDVYNTHLQASYFYRDQNAKTRLRQLGELADFVKSHSSPQGFVVILGDFNFKEDAREHNYFLQELWQGSGYHFLEVMRGLHPSVQSHPLFTYQHLVRKSLKEKIDHKFLHVPKGWTWNVEKSSTQILDWNVSDHAPVLTKLIFTKLD